jgi:Family of unknown function (DUF6064)
MTEWWTYRLQDFLMFAPRTYYRLFELVNAELWPAHALTLGLGVAILVLLRAAPHRPRGAPLACVLLALLWAWVAWAFLWQRYAPINWAARGFAIAFALEGMLLLIHAAIGVGPRAAGPARVRHVGLGLWLLALMLHPAVAPLLGRPWLQAEWFGIAPDPTVLATLGLLVQVSPDARSPAARALGMLLWGVPLLWCAISGATLWSMRSPDAGLLPAAAVVALWAAWRSRIRAPSSLAPRRSSA